MSKTTQWILGIIITVNCLAIGAVWNSIQNLETRLNDLTVKVAALGVDAPRVQFEQRVARLEVVSESIRTTQSTIRDELALIRADLRFLSKTLGVKENGPSTAHR